MCFYLKTYTSNISITITISTTSIATIAPPTIPALISIINIY